jgi:dephospho-CoA kinase
VVLGVTGPVAGGKTSAAGCLAARGAEVLELDRIGHELLGEVAVRAEIDAAFPEVAGAGDLAELRRALGDIVFADAERLAALERILHERMCDRVRERIAARRESDGSGVVVVVGALLYEMGLDQACDAVINVDAPEPLRRERAAASRGWSPEEVSRREARQLAAEVKRGRADHNVENTGSREELEAVMAAIWEEYACP